MVDSGEREGRRAASVGRGRGWKEVLSSKSEDVVVTDTTENFTGVRRGAGKRKQESSMQRKGCEQKVSKTKSKLPTLRFGGGGTVGGAMLRAGRQEVAGERDDQSRTIGEVDSQESWDSRAEKLGRYLSANLALDSDSGDDGDVCAYGGGGGGFSDILSSGEEEHGPRWPGTGTVGPTSDDGLRRPQIDAGDSATVPTEGERKATVPTEGERKATVPTEGERKATVFPEAASECCPGKEEDLADFDDDVNGQFDNFSDQSDIGRSVDVPKPSTNGVAVEKSLAQRMYGVVQQGDGSEDDGWQSDSSNFAAHFSSDSCTYTTRIHHLPV